MKEDKILLKLSGEALENKKDNLIFDGSLIKSIAEQINELSNLGYKVGVVVGGGNIWRGKLHDILKIDQESADYMGMLSTVINSIALANILRQNFNTKVNVYNSLEVNIPNNFIKYNSKKISKQFDKKGLVSIFAGGTGKPFFSTDTSVAQKAVAAKVNRILIGKFGTDGVYDKDPNEFKDAKFIKEITFKDALKKDLKVMDKKALEILENKNIEVVIFDILEKNSIIKAIKDDSFKKTKMN